MAKGARRGRPEMGRKGVDRKDQRNSLGDHELPPNLAPGS